MAASDASQPGVARSAGVVSAAIAASRITGLVRERVMAHLFGAGAEFDAFIIGFRIPNLTRDLFAEGALSSAFVPTFTRYLTTRSQEEARELYRLVSTALMLIVGTLCLLGMLFTPQLVNLFASPFHQVPGKFELAVSMTRIMFPFLLLVALAAQSMGALNALGRFGVPAVSSSFFNIGSVTLGLLVGRYAMPFFGYHGLIAMAFGMAWGVVAGGALQLAFQLPSLWRFGFDFLPRIQWRHEGLRNMMRLMGPALLGNASVQINVLVNSNFASGILDAAGHVINGPVAWLNCAFRFMQLPLGLFGVSIASATLPAISRSAAAHNIAEFRATLARSIGMVLLLTIPSSAGLIVLGKSMIAVVYQSGRFKAYDTHQTALALGCYAVGLSGYAALKVLAPAFYALNDARTPMLVSLVSILVNLGCSTLMIRYAGLGHAGLALSTSTVALFGFAVLFLVMRRRIHGLGEAALLVTFVKICAASAVMSAVCFGIAREVQHVMGARVMGDVVTLTLAIPAGAAVFYSACLALKLEELQAAQRALAGPLLRRLGVRQK
jgi:putative peptidoglycan lipid II flippase